MMLRNDKEIRSRIHPIIAQYGSLFGEKYLVKANKLNARNEASTESKVVARLLKGQAVLELHRQGKWSQVVVLDDETIDRTVWVYNPLLEKNTDIAGGSD